MEAMMRALMQGQALGELDGAAMIHELGGVAMMGQPLIKKGNIPESATPEQKVRCYVRLLEQTEEEAMLVGEPARFCSRHPTWEPGAARSSTATPRISSTSRPPSG
jgi:hypothetical protein